MKLSIKNSILFLGTVTLLACNSGSKLPAIAPDVITEKSINDTDDPAIWIHPTDASKSIVFGTDKETNGAIYAYDLQGKVIEEKTIRNIKRPNNVDLEYGFQVNDSVKVDVLIFTEREEQQIRLFSVPDMKPLDNGGFSVFEDETTVENKLPMGVAIYKSPIDGSFYAIVGRKKGPKEGYLYQYKLVSENSKVTATLVRKFGQFSGEKEIEAIAVDAEMGFVYYSDEMHCVRKYYAEPSKGNEEIACFGSELFERDIEGIAIAKFENEKGYIIVSDQQKGQFNLFDRQTNAFIKAVNLSTTQTDGCDVVTVPLNDTFKSGLFVAMNDAKDFYFYDLDKLLK
ncbi:phytase [Polaribacter undariae]|uniref:Phytase n=1 Tax=Polaribacter sejongensis TaxID=985043 RepID=A0AAJ1VGK5_9FLAO|nr:phytase [Polaribacter undariae]MDN3619379.1 phytase [Polaribacter undariae]UWD33421.1 phytase [Polaribacter undariae]